MPRTLWTDTPAPRWWPIAQRLLAARQGRAAIRLLRSGLAHDARFAAGWAALGAACRLAGDPVAAWHATERATWLDPQQPVPPDHPAAAPGPAPAWLAALGAPRPVHLTGAVLARDAAAQIGACLAALRPAVDRLVVVDTGSRDDTVALARAQGAHVTAVMWPDDFGAARAAAQATVAAGTDAVLWVDADEQLDPADVGVLRWVLGLWAPRGPVVVRVVQLNDLGGRVEPNYDSVRAYAPAAAFTWRGRVHEQVVPVDPAAPYTVISARVRLHHSGYRPDVLPAKWARNLALLRAWTAAEPTSPIAWGFLGRDLLLSGDAEHAVAALRQAITLAEADPQYARTPELYGLLCQAYLQLDRIADAAATAAALQARWPDWPASWYWQAQTALLQARALLAQARSAAQEARRRGAAYRGLVTPPPATVTWLPLLVEADAARHLGAFADARALYQAARPAVPDPGPVDAALSQLPAEGAGA